MTRKKTDASKERSKNEELTINTSHPHAPIYATTERFYINQSGYLCYTNGEKNYTLCNGSIIITKEIYKFHGNGDPEIYFEVEGITGDGNKLRPITVSASDFSSLNWIPKTWGTLLVVMAGQNIKQILATGILLSGANCDRERIITHTGYILKNGKPINFSSASGTLIQSDIKCEIDESLKRYALPEPSKTEDEIKAAIGSALNLLNSHVPEVTGPLFAYTFLAAILPIVEQIVGDTSFLLFLNGPTQSGKSTLAALSTSFFGRFDSQTPPTTFASTANAISAMAYILNGMSLWVDDYNPQEYMKTMNQIFQMLARAAGDHSTRRRLDSNAKLKESYPPRCLFLVTGEFPPKIGQSGHARVFQLDVPEARKDITAIRKDARAGVLARSMSDYIVYIIKDFDRLKDLAKKQYEDILSKSNELFGECRLSNQATLLCLSAYLYFDYAVRCKALTSEEAEKLYKGIESTITINANKKKEQLKQEDPCELYINAIKDLLTSGRAKVIDLTKKDLPEDVQSYQYASLGLGLERDGFIGWKDEKGYYLNTNASYSAVTTYYTKQDTLFVTNPNMLWRRLRDNNYLIPANNNTPCQNKKIGGEARRVLWFPRKVFDTTEDQTT